MRAGAGLVAGLLALCTPLLGAAQTTEGAEESAATPVGAEASAGADTEAATETTETEAPKVEAPPQPPPPSNDTRGQALLAYHKALSEAKLAPTASLSTQRLRDELSTIEDKILIGRRDEAVGDLAYLVESPRFEAFAASDEGRAVVFLLGDSLGRSGAYEPARGYLGRLLEAAPTDLWYRRAVQTLVDLGLESDQPAPFLELLKKVPTSAPEEIRGDVAYLEGRAAERKNDHALALAAYEKVAQRSRFWAQATYLSGLIAVDQKDLKRAEALFCRVADPKHTPRQAALFGGGDFFRVRDLARLGLGRVAHEGYRFDDARYYYYLVPNDSERLPEALYETATTRYEARDYTGAREALDDLKRLDVEHVYQDEAWILDAYVDLAVCRFPQADAKLAEFLKRYEPIRNGARKVIRDSAATRRLVEAVRRGTDPAGAGLGMPGKSARSLASLLRVDAGYGRAMRRLSQLDHHMSGLLGSLVELDASAARLAKPDQARPRTEGPLGQTTSDKLSRIQGQLAEIRRLIRDAETRKGAQREALSALRAELVELEIRAGSLRSQAAVEKGAEGARGTSLGELIAADRARAGDLYVAAERARGEIEKQLLSLARDAFVRLDRRLTRLLNRARLGRIETVLGKKRALELEVEALTRGLLPQAIVDSLAAERYLEDNEEYWPFEGEDWEDEYVGGEGLR